MTSYRALNSKSSSTAAPIPRILRSECGGQFRLSRRFPRSAFRSTGLGPLKTLPLSSPFVADTPGLYQHTAKRPNAVNAQFLTDCEVISVVLQAKKGRPLKDENVGNIDLQRIWTVSSREIPPNHLC
jgi:hypothetical protein